MVLLQISGALLSLPIFSTKLGHSLLMYYQVNYLINIEFTLYFNRQYGHIFDFINSFKPNFNTIHQLPKPDEIA